MTIQEAIDRCDGVKPNTYQKEDKVRWLSFLDATIINEIINMHEPKEDHVYDFEGYDVRFTDHNLIVPFPYDELYVEYLKMKIDEENGETARYNNSAAIYNTHLKAFAKEYHKTHLPVRSRLMIF